MADNTAQLTQFTGHEKVKELITKLKQKFGDNFEKLVVSDTLDEEGHQYVHLVQEGGGVLGIALVGYTYILEQCGIRFLRLAGTSAGAINTIMMAVIGKKEDAKSEKVLDYVCNKNLFDFVDGHPFVKKLIGKVITNKGYFDRLKRWFMLIVKVFLIFLLIDFACIGLNTHFPAPKSLYNAAFVITGVLFTVIAMIVGYLFYIVSRFRKAGFGINPGKDFEDWIKKILEENGVKNIADLQKVSSHLPKGLHIRDKKGHPELVQDMKADITLITSEIISQHKVEFPRMWDLFTNDPNELHPAAFVRASMSIPIFFESYHIRGIKCGDKAIQKAWQKHLRIDSKNIPDYARFVDGGIISNFPISIFYNPKVLEPRMPTFGIDLDEELPEEPDKPRAETPELGLWAYLYGMFNTVRFNFDKDFLIKNELYTKGIGKIQVFDFNWLNFAISEEEKINLFLRGAQAAADFLLGTEKQPAFDWASYKEGRKEVHEKINPSEIVYASKEG